MKLLSFLTLFFVCNAFAENEITDKSIGEFPSEVSFDYKGQHYLLDITGVSTRKKLIIKVYNVAHYLQKDAKNEGDKLQTILSDANAKQLTIKWLRSVPVDKVQETYHESFKNAIPGPDYTKLQNEMNSYLAFFNSDIQKGDEHIIRWIPGGTIEVIFNGKAIGTINNKEFAKGLWSIWFGNKSVVNRDALISSMK